VTTSLVVGVRMNDPRRVVPGLRLSAGCTRPRDDARGRGCGGS
jgi:hypothetical protein